jgi:dihydrofolate reductase
VSHRPKPDDWRPKGLHPVHPRERQASYYFIGDVAQAIAKAKEVAGERTVAVAAGDVGGQAFALGLVDEVAMDVVPVVFGSGKRYFGSVDAQHLLEDPHTIIQGDRVLHLRYRVRR